MNDIMQHFTKRMRPMKLQANWEVFGMLACLHTTLALAVFGPTLMNLFMEVH